MESPAALRVVLGGGQNTEPCFWATVTTGFEYIAEAEIAAKLPLQVSFLRNLIALTIVCENKGSAQCAPHQGKSR